MARKKTPPSTEGSEPIEPPAKKPRAKKAAAEPGDGEKKPKARAKSKRATAPLAERLVLAKWAFSTIGMTFAEARNKLSKLSDAYKPGVSKMAHILSFQPTAEESRSGRTLSDEEIFRADERIRQHTDHINAQRSVKVRWKYFQWLALFFTDVFLDRFFANPEALCGEINAVRVAHNEEMADDVPEITVDGLRRLAFWSATGSGKTLLMHVHVLQYLDACARYRKDLPTNILLVCPREELARQHLEEFALSSIDARYFDPKVSMPKLGGTGGVQVMEITRLREESKNKTVNVTAFGESNLVFVDEAHQGLRADDSVWKDYRDRLSGKGFAFEYSATFGQAAKRDEASDEYARCILFDYSYKRFYDDGYGKDYCILNLQSVETEELKQRYFVGCVLSYYQQLRYYEEYGNALAPYGVARPLWVFVGGKVSAGKDDGVDLPEVVEIIASLQRVCARPDETVSHLLALMKQRSGIVNKDERDVFAGLFPGLRGDVTEWKREHCERLYRDVLARVFLADSAGNVHARLQKNVDHELVLSVGAAGRPFGLVYVGKVRDVEKLCRERGGEFGLVVDPASPGESLFQSINRSDSRTHVLIGSRKFTEGWNSWRVSTLGLMNFGRTEGSQVIQLFGRGVRLRGYEGTLRRSRALFAENALPKNAPKWLPLLETLGVFGVRADYMKSFEEYLSDEGLASHRDPVGSLFDPEPQSSPGTHVVHVPIRVKIPEDPPLYTFVADEEVSVAAWPRVVLDLPTELADTTWLKKHPVTLDWYPHVQSETSRGANFAKERSKKERVVLEPRHIEWLDVDRIVRSLLRQRDEHGDEWCTLSITREGVERLLRNPDEWYLLYLPREFLELGSMRDIERWQSIAETLLGDYCEKFMKRWLAGREAATMRYERLSREDRNFAMEPMPDGSAGWVVALRFDADDKQSVVWRDRYERVVAGRESHGSWQENEYGWMSAGVLSTSQHLFEPLLVFASRSKLTPYVTKISPVALDASEGRFVDDLAHYCKQPTAQWLSDYSIYLLRNQVKRGVSFFEANNFTPDFLLWLTRDKKQCLAVVDPKGIRNLTGINDPKFALHRLIKEREARVWSNSSDAARAAFERVTLESFIVANTRKDEVGWSEHDASLSTFDQWFRHHVVFQHEDKDHYIERILKTMAASIAD
ncbi:MAG: DEAD/DEAH box helicase family protein [Polyangiales bacterium]